jgi:hypothetical protein
MNMRLIIWIVCSSVAVYAQSATDAPKRTVFDSKGATLKKPEPTPAEAAKPRNVAAPENTQGASPRALDSLGSSLEDLNGIRDSNVRGLTKDGCAPEVSARIADLKTRLRAVTGVPDAAEKNSSRAGDDAGSETLALASNWFKSSSAGSSLDTKNKSNELLDSVLPDSPARKPADLRAENRDAAGLKTEIEHLLATCPGAKR